MADDEPEEEYAVHLSAAGYSYTIPERRTVTIVNIAIIISVFSIAFTYLMLAAIFGAAAAIVGATGIVVCVIAASAVDLLDAGVFIPWFLLPAAAAYATTFHGWNIGAALLAADYAMYLYEPTEPDLEPEPGDGEFEV